ncbi:MAG: MazG family protein, partial [Bacteriovoracaceae bacterium]
MSSFVEFENAYKVVKKLRDPNGGCPWDLEQTHKSLAQFAVEEAYELSHAIEEGDPKAIESELGDLLLQVLLHGTIGEENKHFDIESISKALSDKIIGRHPHVFGEDAEKISYEEVKDRWEKMKQEEKASASKGSFYISQEDAFCPSL